MSFLLTSEFDDCFTWNNSVYQVDMNFNNILKMFEMFDDEFLLEYEKPFIAIEMLIGEVTFESYEEGMALYKYLMNEFLDINLDEDVDGDTVKMFDYKKDAEIIYASFYSVYRMDLFEMHDKLHWKKFRALLNNLDDESKLKQVIGIRTMKVPGTDESSQEYRDHIIKMKGIYSLDETEEIESQQQKVISDFARILKSNAKGR
jgi:hypothetical protein